MKKTIFSLIAIIGIEACSNTQSEMPQAKKSSSNKIQETKVEFQQSVTPENEWDIAARIATQEGRIRDSIATQEGHIRDSIFKLSPEAYFNRIDFDLKQDCFSNSHINPYVAFGQLEFEKILNANKRSILKSILENSSNEYLYFANFYRHEKVGKFHFIEYVAGTECENDQYFIIVDEKLNVIDQLECDRGCISPFVYSEDEANKNIVDNYMIFLSFEVEDWGGSLDSFWHVYKWEYTIKDTITNKYYYCNFENTEAYRIDSTGHFEKFYKKEDEVNTDTILHRMQLFDNNNQ